MCANSSLAEIAKMPTGAHALAVESYTPTVRLDGIWSGCKNMHSFCGAGYRSAPLLSSISISSLGCAPFLSPLTTHKLFFRVVENADAGALTAQAKRTHSKIAFIACNTLDINPARKPLLCTTLQRVNSCEIKTKSTRAQRDASSIKNSELQHSSIHNAHALLKRCCHYVRIIAQKQLRHRCIVDHGSYSVI